MVISNKQRKLQNKKAQMAARRKKIATPKPKKVAIKPAQAETDDSIPLAEMDIPTRALAALKKKRLKTKGNIRQWISKNGSLEGIAGIGKKWAELIKKLVR